jgi:hypothetical protein
MSAQHGPQVKVSGVPDSRLAEECLTALAKCAASNNCFTPQGVTISAHCVQTVATHASSADCLSKGFGLEAVKKP